MSTTLEKQVGFKENLLGRGHLADPYPVYDRLRAEGPVHRVPLRDGVPCWVIVGYAEARAALEDRRLSRDPRNAMAGWSAADRDRPLEDGADLGAHLLTRDPPDHSRLRRALPGVFGPKAADRLRPRIQRLADDLIDALPSADHADLIADFAYPLAAAVLGDLLGIPEAHHHYFRQWTSNAVKPGPPDVPPPGRYVKELVALTRRNSDPGPLGVLVKSADRGEISETELESMIFLLIVAGHEGSVAMVAMAITSLLRSPHHLALLREHPELAPAALEELLRFDGPMEFAAWRFATEPIRIGTTVIPTGAPVAVALGSAHRDPAAFADPGTLDFTRPRHPHLAFGHGLHYCPGAALARVEGTTAITTLLRRLPDLALAIPADDLRRQPSQIVRGLHDLPVTFDRA